MNDTDRQRLLAQCRPDGWRNPDPAALYDLVVVGGGTAGLVSAVGAAGLGARVALVERGLLGGDCLNTGCVPSKALIRSARAVHEARTAAAVGVRMTAHVDFAAVMAVVRSRQADLAHHDSASRLASLGVHVFFGEASFTGPRTLNVGASTLTFRRAVVATGGRPLVPPIRGLAGIPYLTNENVFQLSEQPRTLLVIGGGSIGCELAQAFALLGTRVTLAEAGPRILPNDDPDAADIVLRHLKADGVQVLTGVTLQEVRQAPEGLTALFDSGPSSSLGAGQWSADTVLVATGRAPNTEGLNLEAAGITHGAEGVHVDDHLRTSNRRVFAAGDVCSPFKFTHAADAMARIVIQNALFPGRRRVSSLVIPWSTYTFPEVAHVGVAHGEAARLGAAQISIPLTEVDRAVIDGEADGFFRVYHRSGHILGATLVAPRAGELIGHVTSVMRRQGSLADLSADIFPYPTVADVLRKAGDAYRRTSLTPGVRRMLLRYFALVRGS